MIDYTKPGDPADDATSRNRIPEGDATPRSGIDPVTPGSQDAPGFAPLSPQTAILEQNPMCDYRSNYVSRGPAGAAQVAAVEAEGWTIVSRAQHSVTMDRIDVRRPKNWKPGQSNSAPSASGGVGTMLLGAAVIIAVLGGIGFWIGRATADTTTTSVGRNSSVSSDTGGIGVSDTSSNVSASCMLAISEAREGFTLAGDSMGIMSQVVQKVPDAMRAAAIGNASTMSDLAEEIGDLNTQLQANTTKLKASDFQRYATKCENG